MAAPHPPPPPPSSSGTSAVGNIMPGSLRAVERALSRFDLGRSSGRGVGIDDRDKSGQGESEGGGIRLLTRRISERKKGAWLLFASDRHFTLRREMVHRCTAIRHPPSAAPRHTRIPAIGEDPTKQESLDSIERLNLLIYRERHECIICRRFFNCRWREV